MGERPLRIYRFGLFEMLGVPLNKEVEFHNIKRQLGEGWRLPSKEEMEYMLDLSELGPLPIYIGEHYWIAWGGDIAILRTEEYGNDVITLSWQDDGYEAYVVPVRDI